MLLDRIDIDTHGPLNRVELGPFCEGLNVVFTPEGSGKTALARFVRDSLIRRDYPLGMMSSSAGRVVWADRNGKIHCRREHDGTPTGRRTVEFESRGDQMHRFDWLHGSWIEGVAESTDASRALESIRIPESIVDGLLTDTAVTSVSRVVHAALTGGLSDPSLFANLPVGTSAVSGMSPAESSSHQEEDRVLRDELARIEAELASLRPYDTVPTSSSMSDAIVQQRRYELERRLAWLRAQPTSQVTTTYATQAAYGEMAQLQDRIWSLRVRQAELTRWLDALRHERNRAKYSSPVTAAPYATGLPAPLATVTARPMYELDARLRQQLTDIDQQIARWRRVSAEIDGLSHAVATDVNRRSLENWVSGYRSLPISDETLRRERMYHVLSAVDYLAMHPEWNGGVPVHQRFEDRLLGRLPSSGYIAGMSYGDWTNRPHRWPDEIDLRVESVLGHIDWLNRHYRGGVPVAWYQGLSSNHGYRGTSTLVDALGAMRADLVHARRHGFMMAASGYEHEVRRERNLLDLEQCRHWVVAAIDQLLSHRESLVRDRQFAEMVQYPRFLNTAVAPRGYSPWYVDHVDSEYAARTRELESVARELDERLLQAAELRRNMMALPVVNQESSLNTTQAEVDSIIAELQSLQAHHHTPALNPRLAWLERRRAELLEQLAVPHAPKSTTPLADEASQWLVRLSAGRLRRVDWNPAEFTTNTASTSVALVTIGGRPESECSANDRAYAALAVRMAAADLLRRTNRSVPLVVEAHRELLRPVVDYSNQYAANSYSSGIVPEVNLAVIAALDDYAKLGNQVILLGSDAIFAEQVARRGGRVFQITGERVSQQHRPLWQPHYGSETYAGPHINSPVPLDRNEPLHRTDAYINRYDDEYFQDLPIGASLADVNRNLDAIWQEAYGVSPHSVAPPSYPPVGHRYHRHDGEVPYGDSAAMHYGGSVASHYAEPVAGMQRPTLEPSVYASQNANWHDGYYFADRYTTSPATAPVTQQYQNGVPANAVQPNMQAMHGQHAQPAARSAEKPAFFLNVDSPIDQAPSVDAVAAARLRRLNVTHINHLMSQDPNRLADALGLASVNAATIRRWQSECRLVCYVPQLRGFDARVLVGCGITDAEHLASTDPNDLLDRVEAFLATERGQRILLSGTSYELSRITRWIAAANVHPEQVIGEKTVNGRVLNRTKNRRAIDLDQDRYEYEFVDDNGDVVRAKSSGRRGNRSSSTQSRRRRGGSSTRSERGESSSRSRRQRMRTTAASNELRNGNSSRSSSTRSGRNGRSGSRRSSSSRGSSERSGYRTARTRGNSNREGYGYESYQTRTEGTQSNEASNGSGVRQWRFYLHRESPVVDAPSIGSRMAERLQVVGVLTVDDLLNADAESLAEQLDYRRIDASVITTWQQQASLVCRVPMLRGHDAQLLVAAGISTPEEVSAYSASDLFALIEPIASSSEGQRILRGGKDPDLEEITEWIEYANHRRELSAA